MKTRALRRVWQHSLTPTGSEPEAVICCALLVAYRVIVVLFKMRNSHRPGVTMLCVAPEMRITPAVGQLASVLAGSSR